MQGSSHGFKAGRKAVSLPSSKIVLSTFAATPLQRRLFPTPESRSSHFRIASLVFCVCVPPYRLTPSRLRLTTQANETFPWPGIHLLASRGNKLLLPLQPSSRIPNQSIHSIAIFIFIWQLADAWRLVIASAPFWGFVYIPAASSQLPAAGGDLRFGVHPAAPKNPGPLHA